ERKDLLCGLFWMLALWTYVRYAQNLEANPNSEIGTAKSSRLALRSFHFPWLALLFFAMALMSKPMAITLPFVLLLLDYWPLRRLACSEEISGKDSRGSWGVVGERQSISWLVIEKLPLFAMSVASAVVTMKAQRAGGAVTVKYPLLAHVQNAIVSYVLYIAKAIWSARLAALYPYP